MKLSLSRPILVEGKYDKIRLENIFDTVILTTDGFSLFRDTEKADYLRRLADRSGLIVCTDSDSAGFVIRNHIKSILPPDRLIQVYLPELAGKEKRKARPSAEGLLGVEGTPDAVIVEAFRRAGALDETPPSRPAPVTRAELYEWGLIGGRDSAAKREELLLSLGLPRRLSATAMLDALNILFTREEIENALRKESESWQEIRSKN